MPHTMKGVGMDVIEKAKIRIEHWIRHNKDHLEAYKAFARELEAADRMEKKTLTSHCSSNK